MRLESIKNNVLYLGGETSATELHAIAGGSAAVYSARCPGRETPNEDAAALLPINAHAAVFAVADGLGGVRAGARASMIAIEALKSSLENTVGDGSDLRDAILNGIEQANRAVQELGVGAATTLAVAEINGSLMRPYHVGDSAILVFGQRGKQKLQTVPHSPVGFAVEAGFLDEEEAMHHAERHLVSNVIGTAGMRIEMGAPFELAQRDTVLLASDGLLDNLEVVEIVDRLRKGPIGPAADLLVRDSLQRMTHPKEGEPSKPDDLTFVVFRGAGHVRK